MKFISHAFTITVAVLLFIVLMPFFSFLLGLTALYAVQTKEACVVLTRDLRD